QVTRPLGPRPATLVVDRPDRAARSAGRCTSGGHSHPSLDRTRKGRQSPGHGSGRTVSMNSTSERLPTRSRFGSEPTALTRAACEGLSRACDTPYDNEEFHISEPRINERIRVSEVRLVGPAGEQVGIVRVEDALRLAQEADLDLVEVAPDARPPVAKLMDYGKIKYEDDMKAREARRNQANTVLKEIRLRLKIDPHDYG